MPEGQGDNAPEHTARAMSSSDPALHALDLPSSFGKYFLTEKLATGGMAEIYLAKIVGPGGFEKPLVIKQIHPKLSGQRHFVDLFVAEAKTLVTLAHGNIVPVYELGVIDDTYFIAMEYIDGPTLYRLTEIVRRRAGRMDPAIAAWITARILEGLDYAHRKGEGVIHRDLSPRNVMLSRDGEVKLVDFGIAVTLGTGGDDPTGESAPTGSFPYMSPEQVRKQPLTVQTDLFSVGVLFWEMLVGRRLFARSDPDATLHAVVEGDIPRPSSVSPEVPTKLDDVVMRALERGTHARWPTAGDMLAPLQRYLYSLDAPPGPRDVAALVAKHCPPEARRFPTHHDPDAPDAADGALPRRPGSARLEDDLPAGPRTAVIPRAGSPRGKSAARARTETFATNVDLEHILDGTALPFGGRAPAQPAGDRHADAPPDNLAITIRSPEVTRAAPRARSLDDVRDAPPTERAAPSTRPSRSNLARTPPIDEPAATIAATEPAQALAATTPATPVAVEHDAPDPAMPNRASHGAPELPVPGRTPPSRGLLVVAGLGASGLAIASVFVFLRGRDAMQYRESLAGDAALAATALPHGDDATLAGAPVIDAGAATSATTAADASLAVEPASDDAAVSPSPPRTPRLPAGGDPVRPRDPAPRSTRTAPSRLDAPAGRPTGTATLTIGADPWGNVILDGKRIGRTPIEHLAIPAGRHAIEVTFSGEDPPRTLKYTVDLGDGEARTLQADFTKP